MSGPVVMLDTVRFWRDLDLIRDSRRMRWADVARTTGISASTFTRLAAGGALHADAYLTLLVWMGVTDHTRWITGSLPEENPS